MRAGHRDPSWHPGYPRPDDVDAASLARDGETWGPRHIMCDGQAVGTIGPLGPPEDGEVEVGYGLVEAARGRGLATEALRALLAETDAAGVRVRAGVRPDNGGQPQGPRRMRVHRAARQRRRGRAGARASAARPRAGADGVPRLVATDLDGTLLRSDGTVSPYTAGVLEKLDRRGVTVVIVTARPLRWMQDLWQYVGSHGLAIVSNGAIVYDVGAGRVRELTGIDVDEGLALVAAITAAVPEAAFAIECESGIRLDPRFHERHEVPEGSPVGDLGGLWEEPAVKLMVRCEGLDPDELRKRVIEAVGDLAVPTWSGEHLVEISAPGITKASTLARICADLGVDARDVVAFGDMPNDLPMLAWAGTSYAMANADPAVIAAADHVAPANDDDGVATVLVGLFDL